MTTYQHRLIDGKRCTTLLEVRYVWAGGSFVGGSQSINNLCCDWAGPCGSYYDYKMHFSNNGQEIGKHESLLLKGLEMTQHAWDHKARLEVERD